MKTVLLALLCLSSTAQAQDAGSAMMEKAFALPRAKKAIVNEAMAKYDIRIFRANGTQVHADQVSRETLDRLLDVEFVCNSQALDLLATNKVTTARAMAEAKLSCTRRLYIERKLPFTARLQHP